MPDADDSWDEWDDPEDEYDDPFAAIIDRVLESPQVRSVVGRIEYVIDRAGNAIDPRRYPDPGPPPPPVFRRPEPAAPPPPKQPPRRRRKRKPDKVAVARAILHFSQNEPLDRAKIQLRRRKLAELCHPDKGGDVAAMVKINQAADVLLASIR